MAVNARVTSSGHLAAGEADPGDVGVDRARLAQLAPQIDQDQFVGADRPRALGRRHVVRIARVLLGGDVGQVVGAQPFLLEPAQHQRLDVVLGGRHAVTDAPRDGVEGLVLDPVERRRRRPVAGDRRVVPGRLEALHQIPRRRDLHAACPHHLDGPGVDARDVGDRAQRGVLHRDALHALENLGEAGVELFTAGVDHLAARQVVQREALDGVNQGARLAVRGNQVEPPAGGHLLPQVQPHDALGDGVGAVEVVQQPSVEAFRAEGRLDGRHVERHVPLQYKAD